MIFTSLHLCGDLDRASVEVMPTGAERRLCLSIQQGDHRATLTGTPEELARLLERLGAAVNEIKEVA